VACEVTADGQDRKPELPRYSELPRAGQGGRSGWQVFGADDNIGLVNLLTADKVRSAARLIRKGSLFPLDLSPTFFSPPLSLKRHAPQHRVTTNPGKTVLDDVIDDFYPQVSSQWDAIGHVGYAEDAFYNAASLEDVVSGHRNTIGHVARHGIAGRAVLLDVPRATSAMGESYDPSTNSAFGVAELEKARCIAGVDFEIGDIVLIYTGFIDWYRSAPATRRAALPGSLRAPGLAHSEEVCTYFWDHHVAAVASDTFAVEVWPPDHSAEAAPFGFLHRILLGQFGMLLGELWDLGALVDDCAADNVWEMFLASVPLTLAGCISSTANAVAIK